MTVGPKMYIVLFDKTAICLSLSITMGQKTYNSGYSLVVTHLTTNPPVRCLNRAERTGSLVFNVLWSYVQDKTNPSVYIPDEWGLTASRVVVLNSFRDVVSGGELALERQEQMALAASMRRGRSIVLVWMFGKSSPLCSWLTGQRFCC